VRRQPGISEYGPNATVARVIAAKAGPEQHRGTAFRISADWTDVRALGPAAPVTDPSAPTADWLQDFIHPADRPRVRAAVQRAIQTKATFELEYRVRVGGSVRRTYARAVPLLDASGAIIEWLGAANDVTDRKARKR
jgi:hypothetical protein